MLTYQQFTYSLILVLLSAATGLFALSRWRVRRTVASARFVSVMLGCAALWILANGFEVVSADLPTALFWNKLQYITVIPIPVLWFGLAQQLTGTVMQRILRRMLLAAIVPALGILVLLTNDHGLFIAAARLTYPNSVAYLDTDSGPIMILEYVYEYFLTFVGVFILARKSYRSAGFQRQASVILLGVVLTIAANILDWSHLNPIPQIRLTPWALVLAVPLFVLTLLRARRADIVPIARGNVIQIMQDAVLVLDDENRIIDMNPAAENIVGQRLAEVFGKTIGLVWSEWVTHVDAQLQKPADSYEIRLSSESYERIFDVRRSELTDWRGQRFSQVVVLREITMRAHAEEALQMSEEYFRALSEHATDSVLIFNADATIGYASPSVERAFGFKVAEILGANAVAFVHPDDVGIALRALGAAAEQPGIAIPLTARFGLAEGGWRKLECTVNNLLAHPFIKGIVVNARDITERAEAEERLRLSEEYFRALTENATDVTIITSIEGIIQYISPSLERIFGRYREEVVGKNTLEFIHPDDVSYLAASMLEAMLQEEPVGMAKVRFHDKNGGWHVLECQARSMLDHPAVKGIVINARDVTEREAVAEALRQSEERYRLHFANVNDVVYSYDSRCIVQTMSPSVTRHLGIKPEEAIGKSILELGVLPPEYLEKAAGEAAKVLAGERIEDTLYELVGRDGTRKIAEISSSPIYAGNNVIAAVNVARDITERVRTEEKLRASLAEKEILLKEIHHRVKNNLQIIVSLLSLQSNATDNPLAIAQFRESQNRVRSMALIHERLYRSQDLAQIDFGTYLRDLAGYLMQSYKEQSAGVKLTVETDDIHLDIDTAIPCGLLAVEMVSNALKHAFPNGRIGAISVDMRLFNDTCYRLSVCDDGVGFPAHVDFRDTTSLGLQLVNSLTHQLGGAVEMELAQGTKFVIQFPISLGGVN